MKKIFFRIGSFFFSVLALLGLFAAVSYAATAITATQTVANFSSTNNQTATNATTTANVVAGTNDQTLTLATTTANVPQVKASRTLTVNSVPVATTTTTIGSCVVTYSSATSSDSTNCAGNAATVSLITHLTAASIATQLASLTNIGSTNGHGALTVSSSTATTITYSTAGTEASTTPIAFTDGTSGAVSSTASVNGVVPVAEVVTLTVGGTVDPGDVFTVTNPTATFNAVHTVPANATTTTGEANGIANSIVNLGNYNTVGFTLATSTNVITLTATTPGTPFYIVTSAVNRAAAAQVNTITFGGTPEPGDIYNFVFPAGNVSYTTVASDTSLVNIAMDVNAAIRAASSYSSQPFTSAASGATLVLTAKVAGTGFAFSNTTTNALPIAQTVTFGIPPVSSGATYTITLNGTPYSATGVSADSIVPGLISALAGNPVASCTNIGYVITCTALTPGTAFTYATTAADTTIVSSSGSVSGGGGGFSSHTTTVTSSPATHTTAPTNTTTVTTQSGSASAVAQPAMIGGAAKIKGTLSYLSRNNSVTALQKLFASDPNLHYTAGVTGYFGLKTRAAVELFQTTYGVATPSDPGYGLVGPKTRAALVRVYGN